MGIFRREKPQPKAKAQTPSERTLKDCIRMIEGFLKKAGYEPSNQRLPGQGQIGWWVMRGSALVYIHLFEYDNYTTVRLVSPILFLPEDRIVAFYRSCLEINMGLLNCALGVQQDMIAVVSERPIRGLDPIELVSTIDYLSAVADDLDDKLALEFGAKLYGGGKVS